ncbi:DUF3054 domain-containing protein [Pseudonocardia hispaniensis]|uniref:DUF3054 domain-containing protein n=1 Tax=Pseudonocardia hispaniensis TaxID=904933 RepID=A0ABW1IXA2_9PSEU
MVHEQHSRIPVLALAADAVAVVVFAALGRLSHDESGDLLGLLGTAAPFLIGLAAAWATPWVRAHPIELRSGAVVVGGTAVLGLLVRAAFTGRLPASFAIVAGLSLVVLLLGWRVIALLVSRHRARAPR